MQKLKELEAQRAMIKAAKPSKRREKPLMMAVACILRAENLLKILEK